MGTIHRYPLVLVNQEQATKIFKVSRWTLQRHKRELVTYLIDGELKYDLNALHCWWDKQPRKPLRKAG